MIGNTASYDNLTSTIIIRFLIKSLPRDHPIRKALEGLDITLQEDEGVCVTHISYPESRFEVTMPSDQNERAANVIGDMIFLCRLASNCGFDLQFYRGLPIAYDKENDVFLPFGFHFKNRSDPKTSHLNTVRQVVRDIGNPYYEAMFDVDENDIDNMMTHILHIHPHPSAVIEMQKEPEISGVEHVSRFFDETDVNDVLFAYHDRNITSNHIERLNKALQCI